MLVSDRGDHFQVVCQPDHGELSGQIAAAWTDLRGLSALIRRALIVAAARHDDGWAVWERHPRLDESGRPQSFLDVPRDSLLSSYRACVEVLEAEDPAAALLVSMHVSGLQRNRYGVMESPEVTALQELAAPVREFVAHEERRQARLAESLGVDEDERWWAYRLLQCFDVFSLYLGLADLAAGEQRTLPASPARLRPPGAGVAVGELTLTGTGEWSVSCAPFPFDGTAAELRMRRRVVGKRSWPDEAAFREDFARAQVEEISIRLLP